MIYVTLGIDYKAQVKTSPIFDAHVLQFLEVIPMEPIHIDDLALKLSLSIDKVIEYVTLLSLNGDVIISSGQLVSRRV